MVSVCPGLCVHVCVSVSGSVCWCLCVPVCVSVCRCLCVRVCVSVSVSLCRCLCVPVCVSLSVCPGLCLGLCGHLVPIPPITWHRLLCVVQQIAEESQVRIELQMALDSKDSDIEQLRSQLQALHLGMDSASTGSGPGDAEADDSFPGRAACRSLARSGLCVCLLV